MKKEVLHYLDSFNDDEYHELNIFIKEKLSGQNIQKIKKVLQELSDNKPPLVEIHSNKHSRWGLHTPNIHPEHNVVADLDNWIVRGKITEDGRKFLLDSKTEWYKTEMARIQYEDYPSVRKEAKLAISISIAALLLTLILGLMQLKCNG